MKIHTLIFLIPPGYGGVPRKIEIDSGLFSPLPYSFNFSHMEVL